MLCIYLFYPKFLPNSNLISELTPPPKNATVKYGPLLDLQTWRWGETKKKVCHQTVKTQVFPLHTIMTFIDKKQKPVVAGLPFVNFWIGEPSLNSKLVSIHRGGSVLVSFLCCVSTFGSAGVPISC